MICVHCKKDKVIHFFPPHASKARYPTCTKCLSERAGKKYGGKRRNGKRFVQMMTAAERDLQK
jgi:hypothetical protein